MAEQKDIRVAWLSGDRTERRKLLDRIRKQLGECEEVRFGEGATFEEVERTVVSGDCFFAKKLVILDALPIHAGAKATLTNDLKKLMDKVPPDCLLVFTGLEVSAEKGLSTHAGKVGKVFDFPAEVEASEAAQIIIQSVASGEKSIDAVLANRLVSLMMSITRDKKQVYNIEHLRMTADKLVAMADRRRDITEEDVLLCTPDLSSTSSWLFYDAIDDKDFDRAHALLQKLLVAEGDKAEGCRLTLHGLAWRYRLLVTLQSAQRNGTAADVMKTAKEVVRVSGSGAGLKRKFKCDGQLYSDAIIYRMLGSGSPLAKYTPKRLMTTFEAVEKGLEATRYTSSLSILQLIVTSVLMTACERHDDTSRSKHHRYFEEFAAE